MTAATGLSMADEDLKPDHQEPPAPTLSYASLSKQQRGMPQSRWKWFLLCSLLGFGAILLPVFLGIGGHSRSYRSAPLLGVGLDQCSFWTIAFLAIVGCIVGTVSKLPVWAAGIGTVLAFPIITLIEVILWPSSHNLWPFELVIDLILTLPGILGAWMGKVVAAVAGWER